MVAFMKGAFADPEYRAVTVVALIQSAVVTIGILFVINGVRIASRGTVTDEDLRWEAILIYRHGLVLFLIPTLWTIIGTWMVRTATEEWPFLVWKWFGVIACVWAIGFFLGLGFSPRVPYGI